MAESNGNNTVPGMQVYLHRSEVERFDRLCTSQRRRRSEQFAVLLDEFAERHRLDPHAMQPLTDDEQADETSADA